jgi:hypothetical protein
MPISTSRATVTEQNEMAFVVWQYSGANQQLGTWHRLIVSPAPTPRATCGNELAKQLAREDKTKQWKCEEEQE